MPGKGPDSFYTAIMPYFLPVRIKKNGKNVAYLNRNKTAIHEEIIYVEDEIDDIKVEVNETNAAENLYSLYSQGCVFSVFLL